MSDRVTLSLADVRDAGIVVGGRTVWTHVNASIAAGEFVAVLGPNGVGKSTLLKAILGLLPLAAGSVSWTDPADRRAVGYLPQRRSFDPSLRVRGIDVVRLGVDGDRWGVPLPGRRSRAAARRVRDLVDLVGAAAYAHRPIGQLSGGEQQRLLIAQALARSPRLLMLDEPLDSLDLPNQAAIAALISRICRDEGVAVIMVAHDVNPILAYLDRVIYLGQGGALTGAPSEVITSETLTALYGTPIEVLTTSDGRLVVVGQPEAPAHHTDRHAGHGGHGHSDRAPSQNAGPR
ncbi:MAG TPA: metal ABC transporter ATP-binding protein [Micromonosporaceae bacterium]|jgi:zinc/manganese transport system ATP-binding protein|nr:metal ABC transporter ATP-binding protein [Micromonosporaceae bacterium]